MWINVITAHLRTLSTEIFFFPIKIPAMKSAGHVHYNLTGDDTGFIIQEAVYTAQHVVTPYTIEKGSVVTYVMYV